MRTNFGFKISFWHLKKGICDLKLFIYVRLIRRGQGIASNKLLAKIASAKNKPDRQTLIPPRAVPGLMKALPLKKIKLLGGKLGEEMTKKWGCTTAGEAQQIPHAALVACFGDRLGTYAWKAVQGLKAEQVQVKDLVKSMLASKSFGAINELAGIRRWLSVLSHDLAIRMSRDFEMNQRQPKVFQLYYRSGKFKNSADHSRSAPMPRSVLQVLTSPAYSDTDGDAELSADAGGEAEVEVQGDLSELRDDPTADNVLDVGAQGGVSERTRALAKVLEDTSFRVVESIDDLFPCTRIAIAASGFQELPSQGTKSIHHFFTSSTGCSTAHQQNESMARQSTNISPSKKSTEKPKGILKYLGSNTALPTTPHNESELAPSIMGETPAKTTEDVSPSKRPVEKRKGTLKYMGSDCSLPTVAHDEQELRLSTSEASHLHADSNDDVTTLCNPHQDLVEGIDLETVDVEEQRHILEGIYRSRQSQSAGSSLQPTKKGRKQKQPDGSSKRAREQVSVSQPKQPGIGTYFRACDKA